MEGHAESFLVIKKVMSRASFVVVESVKGMVLADCDLKDFV